MARRCTVKITANFQRNLDSIQAFLAENDAQPAFRELLGQLFDSVPRLEGGDVKRCLIRNRSWMCSRTGP